MEKQKFAINFSYKFPLGPHKTIFLLWEKQTCYRPLQLNKQGHTHQPVDTMTSDRKIHSTLFNYTDTGYKSVSFIDNALRMWD